MLPEWFYQLGLMQLPLAACSVVAMMLCFERMVFVIRARFNKEQTYRKIADYLEKHKHYPKPLRDEMVAVMLSEVRLSYYRSIKALRMIGTISPMLGLLGTILGIIKAFRIISASNVPVSPSMIADGLWEAMLTTAVGLFIALPSLLMAHLFKHLSESQLDDICLRLNKFSIFIETQSNETQSNEIQSPKTQSKK